MAEKNTYGRKRVRGISTDKGFTDEVVENKGIPIVSGGGISDNALINSGEATGPISTLNIKPDTFDDIIINNDILKPITNLSLNVTVQQGDLYINEKLNTNRSFLYTDKQLSDGLTFEVKSSAGISKEKYYLVSEENRTICLYQTIRESKFRSLYSLIW